MTAVIPVTAEKTLDDTVRITANMNSLVRGTPFSVTITGMPDATYYVWLENTNGLDINTPGKAPPVIVPSQGEVYQGNTLAYESLFEKGAGKTIGDDAYGQCSSGIPRGDSGCSYSYAAINTNHYGLRIVEFSTSPDTKVQVYSIRVERHDYSLGFIGDSVKVKVKAGKV